jgi:hypothetical protein
LFTVPYHGSLIYIVLSSTQYSSTFHTALSYSCINTNPDYLRIPSVFPFPLLRTPLTFLSNLGFFSLLWSGVFVIRAAPSAYPKLWHPALPSAPSRRGGSSLRISSECIYTRLIRCWFPGSCFDCCLLVQDRSVGRCSNVHSVVVF